MKSQSLRHICVISQVLLAVGKKHVLEKACFVVVNCTNYMGELFIIVQNFFILRYSIWVLWANLVTLCINIIMMGVFFFFFFPQYCEVGGLAIIIIDKRNEPNLARGQSVTKVEILKLFFLATSKNSLSKYENFWPSFGLKIYGEFGTFFFPKQTLCTLSWLWTGVFFCHYCATIPTRRRKKKTLIITHCNRMWVFLSSSSNRPWLMTQVWYKLCFFHPL